MPPPDLPCLARKSVKRKLDVDFVTAFGQKQ